MSTDPYSSPASFDPPGTPTNGGAVPQGVLRELAGTKPWVRFISVLMFIGAGLLFLLSVVLVLMGSAIAQMSNNPMFSGGLGVVIAVVYAVMAAFYIYPALKLWKYASWIGTLLGSASMVDLETALSQQRSFWKFVGVVMLVILSLYALVFLGGAIVGGIGLMSGSK